MLQEAIFRSCPTESGCSARALLMLPRAAIGQRSSGRRMHRWRSHALGSEPVRKDLPVVVETRPVENED